MEDKVIEVNKKVTLYRSQFKDIENGYPGSAWEELLRHLGVDTDLEEVSYSVELKVEIATLEY